ncbi:MAG: M28 family peptidase, partial [candidate division WOR-3 bacterium]
MKHICSSFLVMSLTLFVGVLEAKPFLIAVELSDQNQIELWCSMRYPTYDFVFNTAIAEVDDSETFSLEAQGFQVRVIDEAPWSESYFMCSVPPHFKIELPGEVLWSVDGVYLIKMSADRTRDLIGLRVEFRPLSREVLSSRFWEKLVYQAVPIVSLIYDPFIQSLVDQVNTDSLTSYIQRLEDFKTRLALSDSSYAASEWLRQRFNGWGYAAEFDSFYIETTFPGSGYERNVIAALDGTVEPDKTFIICGHFDSIVFDLIVAMYNAPGADDNASSVAVVLEAARILKNYSWKKTLEFIGWAAEEPHPYRLGSDYYARRADSLDQDIGGVVNLDMIGYMNDPLLDCVVYYGGSFSRWLSDVFYQAGYIYVPSLLLYQEMEQDGSDEYSFYIRGYSAIGVSERWFYQNPHYHDTTDLLSTLSPELYTNVTKAAVATIAILGLYPYVVQDVIISDIGDGHRLEVDWSANSESDIVGYNVCWGRESGVYTDTHFVAGITHTTDTLTNLMTDSTYYIAVAAKDIDNRESPVVMEVIGVPRLVPLVPHGVVATLIISGIRIDWQPNKELDLEGYRVYRRIDNDPQYDSMNVLLLPDTTFTNAPLSGANKYYYAIRAFDMDGNASPMSSEVYGRPITLDQGILIVDETRNSPFPPNPPPPDSLQDEFYRYILDGYRYTEFEFDSLVHHPIFADVVPYSTILWHADDYSELMAEDNVEELMDYLDVGGRLWFVGWRPTSDLTGVAAYPADFGPGDFMYDYLKISHVDLSVMSDSFQA